jgi:hypothetical protein
MGRLATFEQLVAGAMLASTSAVAVARKQAEIDNGHCVFTSLCRLNVDPVLTPTIQAIKKP